MGTRNLTMVINKKGDLKVAQYGQWDGHPETAGKTILEFAKDKDKMARLEKELENVEFCQNGEIDNYFEEYDKKCASLGRGIDNRTEADKYWFSKTHSRNVGYYILENIISLEKDYLPTEHKRKIYLDNSIEFGTNSLMCEWAYCINLQTNKLQCFTGFNEDKSKEYPLFATIQEEIDKKFEGRKYKYYGIRLIKEYALNDLPIAEQFIRELKIEAGVE